MSVSLGLISLSLVYSSVIQESKYLSQEVVKLTEEENYTRSFTEGRYVAGAGSCNSLQDPVGSVPCLEQHLTHSRFSTPSVSLF